MQEFTEIEEQKLRTIRERIRRLQRESLVKAQELYQCQGVHGKVFPGSAGSQQTVEHEKEKEDDFAEAEKRVADFLRQKQSELPPLDQKTLEEIYDKITRKTLREFKRLKKKHDS